jgi:amino acid adenylation domain-containing protein
VTPTDPADRALRSGFLRSALRDPGAPALVIGETTLSYGALEGRARRWAHAMVQELGRPPERIGILGQRSETTYAGILAALLGGGAFVPLNVRFPVGRTRDMIKRAELDALVVDSAGLAALNGVLAGLESAPLLLCPDGLPTTPLPAGTRCLGSAELERHPPLTSLPPVLSSDLAYLMFTSGTTGQPKAIPITNGNAVHCIDVMSRRYGITPDDRCSQTFEHTFDLAVFDLFVSWEAGACVYVLTMPETLAPGRLITRHRLTVWFSVPSIPALMRKKNLLRPDSFPSLRLSLFCGEPLARATAEAWQAAAPNSILENLYGPTELTIACFAHRWNPEESPGRCLNDLVPIGHPLPGIGAVMVDDGLAPVGDRKCGELCVHGPQTAPGYWKDPALTAERFGPLPLAAPSHIRFYRTGDRVARLDNGEYAFLGRIDDQMKVLGHRIEPAEVEGALLGLPGVVQAAALGWPLRDGIAEGVVAFVTGTGLDPLELRSWCRQQLPDYMVPREVIVVDDLPMNANGKVDRSALRGQLAAAGPTVTTGAHA